MRSERRRREYLKAMGYTVYRPKAALPGARPSPRWEPEAPSPPPRGGISRPAAGRAGPAERKAPPAPEPEAGKGRPRKPEPVPAAPEPDAGPVWFRAIFHYLDPRLAVLDLAAVDGSPEEERVDRDARALSLLKNILLALGMDAADRPPRSWGAEEWTEKLAKLAPAPSWSVGAREFLAGVVAREREDFAELLVFAGPLDGPLAGLLREGGEPDGGLAPVAAGRRVTLTLSLDEMLADPRRKPEAWGHLRSLRRRLSRPPA